jgi:hypothetical protein
MKTIKTFILAVSFFTLLSASDKNNSIQEQKWKFVEKQLIKQVSKQRIKIFFSIKQLLPTIAAPLLLGYLGYQGSQKGWDALSETRLIQNQTDKLFAELSKKTARSGFWGKIEKRLGKKKVKITKKLINKKIEYGICITGTTIAIAVGLYLGYKIPKNHIIKHAEYLTIKNFVDDWELTNKQDTPEELHSLFENINQNYQQHGSRYLKKKAHTVIEYVKTTFNIHTREITV